MKICLKSEAKEASLRVVECELNERVGSRIELPCTLTCSLQVEKHPNFFLVMLGVKGHVTVNCLRCLHPFVHDYCNQTVLAVCKSDTFAAQLMETYECIVAESEQLDLTDILVDEVLLYCPERHQNVADCDDEVSQYIGH